MSENYWNVVLARKSDGAEEIAGRGGEELRARQGKHWAWGVAALDIYVPQSQVASRRVGVIQAEYSLSRRRISFGAAWEPIRPRDSARWIWI